jgi:hypothetical protein
MVAGEIRLVIGIKRLLSYYSGRLSANFPGFAAKNPMGFQDLTSWIINF